MTRLSVITGTGSALPARRVDNDEMARIVDTSDEWISTRSGIRSRYFAGEGETTGSLATEAARKALEAAGIKGCDIDLIVLGTTTPDQTFPATATTVQQALGCNGGVAFDVQAVCSGFLYALGVADSMLRSGMANRALVIGAETMSRLLDFEDRATCVLFGDGAGAIVLEAQENDGEKPRGILATKLHADGAHNELLFTDGGASTTGTIGKIRMSGNQVFKHAVQNLSSVLKEVLDMSGTDASEVDWVVPHQANARIIEGTAKKLGLPMDRVVMTVDQHANTSAASVPLALDAAVRDGRIKPGQLVVLEAMGGGFTWGASLVRM
ncbi:beta-ketoacyl-ACP synthase III [Novosphingobium sp. TH158]|uniref:beta-ketoacyl-ACP synthase III n=1 Tax=Novosphingobium sp. TH158 TaxID=2067455 RepID=UPI000C7AF934|nr:beta-ketoacyl-ACP synthase III [Novosphingobium sp. TH158]PLK25617.1 3-oxoacyl-ACP synthase [Novosphingobium sp. TH158]